MKNQALKFIGFCLVSQLLFEIAKDFILTYSAGNKVLAMYMWAVALAVYGVVALMLHKKKHTAGWFWKVVRIYAIIMLVAAVISFIFAPFPDLYTIHGMASATALMIFK